MSERQLSLYSNKLAKYTPTLPSPESYLHFTSDENTLGYISANLVLEVVFIGTFTDEDSNEYTLYDTYTVKDGAITRVVTKSHSSGEMVVQTETTLVTLELSADRVAVEKEDNLVYSCTRNGYYWESMYMDSPIDLGYNHGLMSCTELNAYLKYIPLYEASLVFNISDLFKL